MKSKYTRKNIITLPNPRLREKSAKVHVTTDETLQLVDNMIAAAVDWEDSRPHEMAVALAAVQIDQLERVVIIRNDFENKSDQTFTVLINPEITKTEGELKTDHEGCLSIKDVYGLVPRWTKVRVKAIDLSGREIRFKSPNEFVARILQHEVDHCDGKCFVDYITHEKQAFFILDAKGELAPYAYSKVKNSGILLDD
jgi:peptide deformylase